MKNLLREDLPALVQTYFRQHLQSVRGASPHTVVAYRDALRLFFCFLAEQLHRPVAALRLDDLRVEHVRAFLDHLEAKRRNGVVTRNCRLAALHGFFAHLLRHDPTRAEQYQRVLSLPTKKARSRLPSYLEPEEVLALLKVPDRTTDGGRRDYALLLFLYNTGARIGEALRVRPQDLELRPPHLVRLHGKGGKDRICPLWKETARALEELARADSIDGPVFRNSRGAVITRDGVAYLLTKHLQVAARSCATLRRRRLTPHVLRHSCAVALLQAGVDVCVIRDYLGHASITTTSRYITTNLAMKRDALETFWERSGLAPAGRRLRWRPKADLVAFLSGL